MEMFKLIEETLTYRYHHGVHRRHFPAHTSGPGIWRDLPFLAMVHPFETEYHFAVQETRTVYAARPGEIVFVPAHTPHRLNQPRPGLHSAVHIQYAMLGSLDPLSLFTVPYHFDRTQADRVKQDLFDLIVSQGKPAADMDTVLARKEAAFRLLRFILKHAQPKEGKARLLGRFTRIRPVLAYIDRSLGGTIPRDYLAEIAGLSPARFNFLFCEIMGMPPKKYVQNERRKKALELLRDTDLTVEQIAERTGYCDPFHFSKQFKKALGVSPRQFRQALKKQEWVFMDGE